MHESTDSYTLLPVVHGQHKSANRLCEHNVGQPRPDDPARGHENKQ